MLVLGILVQSLGKLILLANYFLNKESITLNFCVNKNKPKLHCNGKCHLKKQLDNVEEKGKEQKQAPNYLKEKTEVLYFQKKSPYAFFNKSLFDKDHKLNKNRKQFYSFSFLTDIFHPPKFNFV